MSKRSLKDTLCTLPEKIYENLICLQIEVNKSETRKVCAFKQYQKKKGFEIKDKINQQINVCL